MDEHEQESRELENHMERALAVAIAHGSSVLEAWAKLSAKRQAQREHPGLRTFDAPLKASTEVALRAREDLAAGRKDATFWRNAPISELMDRMRETGIEPTKLGEPGHDRHWAERAPGEEAMSLYSYAARYADQSAVAASVRDNIAGLITEYGLDPKEMLSMSPDQAAETYTQARAEHYAPEQNPTMTADGSDATDRDGAQVANLVGQAQAADTEAQAAAGQADTAFAAAEHAGAGWESDFAPQQPDWNEQPSRAQRVSTSSAGPAARSASTAARDHPTNPRAATATAGNGPKARRSSGTGANRERGRGM